MPKKVMLMVIESDDNTVEIRPSSDFEGIILIKLLNKTISGLKAFFEEIIIYSFTENQKLQIEIDDVEKLETLTNKEIVELINEMIKHFNAKTFSAEEEKTELDEGIQRSHPAIPPF